MFWIENFAFILLFTLLELALIPFAYFKTFFNILSTSDYSFFKKIFISLFWITGGVIIDIMIMF